MKNESSPRTRTLHIRLNDEEYATLQKKAEESGLSVSALLRDHIGRVRIRNREDEKHRLIMLNRINANLNMIARWCNTHKKGASCVEVIGHLIAISRAITQLVKKGEQK